MLPLSRTILFHITIFACFLQCLCVTPSSVSDATSASKTTTVRNTPRLKILVYVWTVSYSHLNFQLSIAEALAEAGHEVHILGIDSVGPWNLTSKGAKKVIRVAVNAEELSSMDFRNTNMFQQMFTGRCFQTIASIYKDMTDIQKFFRTMCKVILSRHDLLAQLRAEHYDVAMAETFEGCMAGVFHKIKVKTRCCSTFAAPLLPSMGKRFGIPQFSSFMPGMVAPSANAPYFTFYERAINLYNAVYEQIFLEGKMHTLEQALFHELVDPNFPSLVELARNTSLLFVNSNELFEHAHPVSNKIIHIGGIAAQTHPDQMTIKNTAVKKFFAASNAGVVLVSFGSVTETKMMPEALKRAFFGAFAKFPKIHFLWKFARNESDLDENALFSKASNVQTEEWVEQKAILAHPKTLAFITHCGQNSATEAARAGVPVVGIPLFGDQLFNAANLRQKGVGVILDVRELQTGSGTELLVAALSQVLHKPEYRARAKQLQRKLATAPFSPKERLVRWVEFAAQFHDLPELNLPRPEDVGGMLQYHSLDVVGAACAIVLVCAWVVWKGAKVLLILSLRFIFDENSMKGEKKVL